MNRFPWPALAALLSVYSLGHVIEEDVEGTCVDLLQTSSELRFRKMAEKKTSNRTRPYRQKLKNLGDAAYVGEIRVGQQDFDAILDSGSFELVLFTHNCAGCGMAGTHGYDPRSSKSFHPGKLVQELSYGSGDALCRNAFDQLDIGSKEEGGLHVEKQPIWLVQEAKMEILESSQFEAILGIGPPTAVKQQAQDDLATLEALGGKFEAWNVTVPASIKSRIESKKAADHMLEDLHDNVPENLQLQFLSICLGAKSGSVGHATWHDFDPVQRVHEPFKRLAVIGKVTWGLSLKNIHLVLNGQRVPIACSDGCGAVLDTGTSLLTAPTDAVNRMGQVLQSFGANCLKEKTLPTMEFELGGETLTLPPAAFVGFVKGIMPAPWRLHFHQRPFLQVEDCELLMMDTGNLASNTGEGPLWIIGMPFFRHYYTTFDYGPTESASSVEKKKPSIWVAEATESCEPKKQQELLQIEAGKEKGSTPSLLEVDQSQLRLPHWMGKKDGGHLQF
eukprot:symbB.v1.2.016500.t1/scaffold1255.1/size128691/2